MQPPLTDSDLAAKIRREALPLNTEAGHSTADFLIVQQLEALGYTETAKAWEEVDKWYA